MPIPPHVSTGSAAPVEARAGVRPGASEAPGTDTPTPGSTRFDRDPLTALQAITAAQQLAFGPLAFQATSVMRDRGVLAALAEAVPQGLPIEEVAATTGLSVYATRVLLEAGLGLHIVWRRDERFHLGKLGRFLLEDEMTRVNFDFTRDVCYQAAAHLDQSLCEGRPAGLRTLGPWATLYEGLSVLPEPARRSWFAFDHFYSDQAFPAVCERLAVDPPASLLDIGCNTGKWARLCLERMPGCTVGLVDLAIQLDAARANLQAAGLMTRVRCHPTDLLDPAASLPPGYPLIWMSQLLDCFSQEQIVAVLIKVRAALPQGGRLWILELFWDRQRFEAAAFSLQQTSLYFSCVANGNSQMYDSKVFLALLHDAGFTVTRLTDGVGDYHTLVECSAAS
ncbi:MAG: class I SAM-dependent methyltransferase [Burkholderiaceae bacterium]